MPSMPWMASSNPYDPFWNMTLAKPLIAAVNGWAMGGGFIQTYLCDLRLASRNAVFEISEARHWLLGAYKFGFTDTLPWPIATELALGMRMSAERAYEVGFVNRLVDDARRPAAGRPRDVRPPAEHPAVVAAQHDRHGPPAAPDDRRRTSRPAAPSCRRPAARSKT